MEVFRQPPSDKTSPLAASQQQKRQPVHFQVFIKQPLLVLSMLGVPTVAGIWVSRATQVPASLLVTWLAHSTLTGCVIDCAWPTKATFSLLIFLLTGGKIIILDGHATVARRLSLRNDCADSLAKCPKVCTKNNCTQCHVLSRQLCCCENTLFSSTNCNGDAELRCLGGLTSWIDAFFADWTPYFFDEAKRRVKLSRKLKWQGSKYWALTVTLN